MKKTIESRRQFLKQISISAIGLPLLLSCKNTSLAQKKENTILLKIKKNAVIPSSCNFCGANGAPDDVSWKTALADEDDAGEKLIISGTVFQKDGKTPAPNILIYAYHTNAEGFYGRGNGEHPHGKHHGWMLTDKNGKYEFQTIKPAPYPNLNTPAHIHYTITGENFKEDWIDDIWFDGDELITPEIKLKQLSGKGGFEPILKLEKNAGGILTGVRNIRLY
ncbi:MAG: intradiol ring-cleavage dioxygenase [Pyrinomonadaceae bacterium]